MKDRYFHRSLALALSLFLPTALLAAPGKIHKSPHAVTGEYIVLFKDEVNRGEVQRTAERLRARNHIRVERVWSNAVKGFFARMSEQEALALSLDPSVESVEENAEMFFSDQQPTNVDPAVCNLSTQTNCPQESDDRLWHLDRIDQSQAVPSNTFGYCGSGQDVYVYVVDTGVWRGHSEFGNDPQRVLDGYNASGDGPFYPAWDPCHGPATLDIDDPNDPNEVSAAQSGYTNEINLASHGTAVGSLVAGQKVGVAKNAKIVPVKVARCGDYAARVIKANHDYAYGEIVRANGSYYKQTNETGNTGPATKPEGFWTWGQNSGCTKIGTACFAWIGDLKAQTVQMAIEGVDWILGTNNPNPKSHAVVTFSTYRVVGTEGVTEPVEISGSRSLSFEQAVRKLLAAGLTVTASANNQNGNACDTSPGRMSINNPSVADRGDVITVGGSMLLNNPDQLRAGFPNPANGGAPGTSGLGTEPAYDKSRPTLDARWRCGPGDSDGCTQNGMADPPPSPVLPTDPDDAYIKSTVGSNGGACVTLFAPAKNVTVAQITGPAAYRDRRTAGGNASGTSWSAPIVAGVAAQILEAHRTYTAAQVRELLLQNALYGQLDPFQLDPPGVTGTPNILLHTGDVFLDTPVVTPVTNSGATRITVTARHSTPVTYQWYQVNPEFDLVHYNRNAAGSTPIDAVANQSAASDTLTVSPSVRTGYWVRVTSSCATAESDIVVVDPTPMPSAPAALTATASGTSVVVTWSASTNADTYHLERKVTGQPWIEVAATPVSTNPPTTLIDAPPLLDDGVVVYRVRASRGTLFSPYSLLDFAHPKPFTDSVISTSVTTVKAVHVIEIRKGVNAIADAAGLLAPYAAADLLESSLTKPGRFILAADMTDAMSRLNAVRTSGPYGRPAAGFATAPVSGGLIYASQMNDLRNGLQ
jgi:hypothetical protein